MVRPIYLFYTLYFAAGCHGRKTLVLTFDKFYVLQGFEGYAIYCVQMLLFSLCFNKKIHKKYISLNILF
jgi:hypothetical protein